MATMAAHAISTATWRTVEEGWRRVARVGCEALKWGPVGTGDAGIGRMGITS